MQYGRAGIERLCTRENTAICAIEDLNLQLSSRSQLAVIGSEAHSCESGDHFEVAAYIRNNVKPLDVDSGANFNADALPNA